MVNLGTLPSDIIEVICSLAAQNAFEETISLETRSVGSIIVRDHPQLLLRSLPLIHPRWTVARQKALYRHIKISTADDYKSIQKSLTTVPYNGIHVRGIYIRWNDIYGKGEFGGIDG